jgi:hypothetical protein
LVVQIATAHALPMPLSRQLISLIHEIETGRREIDWANLDLLETTRAGQP